MTNKPTEPQGQSEMCLACNGTGQGRGDVTYCGRCGGDGSIEVVPRQQQPEPQATAERLERQEQPFKEFLAEQMEDPEFAEAYHEIGAEVDAEFAAQLANVAEPPCIDCGHDKNDFRFHFEAPGTNWGAALHSYRSAAPASTDSQEAPERNDLCKLYNCQREGMAFADTSDLLSNLLLLEGAELNTTIAHAIHHGLLTRCREVINEYVRADLTPSAASVWDAAIKTVMATRDKYRKESQSTNDYEHGASLDCAVESLDETIAELEQRKAWK